MSKTIVKFDGLANHTVMLTLESKNIDYNFLSVLTHGYVQRYYCQLRNFDPTQHDNPIIVIKFLIGKRKVDQLNFLSVLLLSGGGGACEAWRR